MGKPAPVPMQCAARRYKAILPPPGSRPKTKSYLLLNSIKLSNPRLTDLRLCPTANVLPSNRSLSEISFSELPSQGSRFWETGNERCRDDRLISNYESGDKEEIPAGLLPEAHRLIGSVRRECLVLLE